MNLLLVIFVAIVSNALADSENLEHLRWRVWSQHVPNIVVCNDADIDNEVLLEAINMWKSRGERIGKTVRRSCRGVPSFGDINIYESDTRPGENYGTTVTTVYLDSKKRKTNSLAYARIWIKSDYTDSVNLIAHEIGHALGYRHTSNYYSIMSTTGPIY